MKFLLLLLIIVSPVAGFAQAFNFSQGGPANKNYYVEIPYQNIDGKLFLDAEIGGKWHKFLFDTGAPAAISTALAKELNAKALYRVNVTDANMRQDSSAVVELNDLKLGGLSFNHIPAITLFPDFYKCYNIDGVIGSNLLRNSIVSINNNRHVLIITDQLNRLNIKSRNSLPMITDQGPQNDPKIRMTMTGKSGKVNVIFSFDTGDKSFLRISNEVMGMLKNYRVFDTIATGYGADAISAMGLQNAADKRLLKVVPFVIGSGSFKNLITESNNVTIPAIGSKLLDYGTITLDFINKQFFFDANQPVNDLAEKQWPFRPSFVNGKFVVGVVWPKAVDYLAAGEQIMAIDDEDLSHITLCEILNRKPVMDVKDSVTLTVKDLHGELKKVKVSKD